MIFVPVKKPSIKESVKNDSRFKLHKKNLDVFSKKLPINHKVNLFTKAEINFIVLKKRIDINIKSSELKEKAKNTLTNIYTKFFTYPEKKRYEITKQISREITKKEDKDIVDILEKIYKEM